MKDRIGTLRKNKIFPIPYINQNSFKFKGLFNSQYKGIKIKAEEWNIKPIIFMNKKGINFLSSMYLIDNINNSSAFIFLSTSISKIKPPISRKIIKANGILILYLFRKYSIILIFIKEFKNIKKE